LLFNRQKHDRKLRATFSGYYHLKFNYLQKFTKTKICPQNVEFISTPTWISCYSYRIWAGYV